MTGEPDLARDMKCSEADLNRRPRDFQSLALPTELSERISLGKLIGPHLKVKNFYRNGCETYAITRLSH